MLKIARYYRPYLWSILGVFALTVLQVGANLELPKIMSDIVDVGIVKLGAQNTGSSISGEQLGYILGRGGVMLAVALAGLACTVVIGYLAARFTAGLSRDLRGALFARIERFSFQEYDRFSAASLITRTTADVTQVQGASFMLVRLALVAPLTILGSIVAALRTDLSLSWIIGLTIPVILFAIGITARYAIPLFRTMQERADHLNLVAREGLTGVRVIRAFNRQATQGAKFGQANDELTDTTLRVNNLMVTLMPILMLIVQFASVAIVWFGANLIDAGDLQVGEMMAFLQYSAMMLMSLMMLMAVFMVLPRANVSAERIAAVLDTEPVINDPAHPVESGDVGSPAVEFRNVTFFHDDAEEPSLSGISFKADAGTTTAIIGSTGSGKTTILNLVERLYDATEGEVLVNGVNVRHYAQHGLRQRMAYVPQRSVLFTGTVRSNMAVGRDDATQDQMEGALDTAQALDFVHELDGGLDAEVTQGGTNFSGGQRQRLAIARAIVRDPEIYLFDDAFSALDLRTDAALRHALGARTTNAVTIMVAQRISTIAGADQIIVLENGRVAGIGTHENLLATNGVYREIAESQLTDEEMAR